MYWPQPSGNVIPSWEVLFDQYLLMKHISRGFSVNIMAFLFPSRHYRHDHIQQKRVSGLSGAITVMYGTQQCVSQQKTLILKEQSGTNPDVSVWLNLWGLFNVSTGPELGKERCLLLVLVGKKVNFQTAVSCRELALIAEFQGRIWVCFQPGAVESQQRFCKLRERDRLALSDSESVRSCVSLVLFNETC